jgi:EAL domain-containing protein (putative c-di-GMP-specific phosphodiesterase class I)/FixJ family two-component response regulator
MDAQRTASRTLLIDDDPFVLKLLERQLRQLGLSEVCLFEHAEDALDLVKARASHVDLVFCDLQMPDMDGIEFVRHLASSGYRGSLVFISGEDERVLNTARRLAEAHRIRLLGALSKPVSNECLRDVLVANAAKTSAQSSVGPEYRGAHELADAISQGQLVNHYQPKVELASGRLVGVEALVRWQHPQLGLVYPDHFIDTAEEHGLIDALTRRVMEDALSQAQRWRAAGLDLQIAINISMENLAALDFPDRVAGLAAAAGIPTSRLVLEVTESRLMKDVRAPLDILTRLRLKRIGLSIDDFGTGHSSLVQLRDIPFDELKIDRGFVHGAAADSSRRAIVEATLAMAASLGMKSVAEGLEDRADWDLLRGLGCDVAQGYFIARPMPGEALAAWQEAWQSRRSGMAAALT